MVRSKKRIAPLRGFRLAGIAAGIKKASDNGPAPLDLGAIVANTPSPAAVVLTRNRVCAAPVTLCRSRIRNGLAQAVLVNSGNANAATGPQGMADARALSAAFAQQLGIRTGDVLPCSTGVIGVPLPRARMEAAMPELATALSLKAPSYKDAKAFSEAILTTDQGPKVAEYSFAAGKASYRVVAIAKGAGMIHPNMATTLAFLLTDAPIASGDLRATLRAATEVTFNRISVDGDTSTNDTIAALASPEGRPLRARALNTFEEATRQALGDVAEMIVGDGEGAKHVAEIRVRGARSDGDALKVARTIATSNLVKTAMHGQDPNWGRIAGAAGRAGVAFDQNALSIRIGSTWVFEHGQNVMDAKRERAASRTMAKARYVIEVHLGDARKSKGSAHYLTCDLGHDYVSCNADYRS